MLWHHPSLGLEWKLTFSSPVATAEFPNLLANWFQHFKSIRIAPKYSTVHNYSAPKFNNAQTEKLWCGFFWIYFLSLYEVCLRFIHVVWINSLFLLIFFSFFFSFGFLIGITLWVVSHIGYLTIQWEEHPCCYQFLAVIDKTVRNIYMHVLCGHKFHFSLLRVELLLLQYVCFHYHNSLMALK